MRTEVWISWSRTGEPWVHQGDVHKCNVLVDQDESCRLTMIEDMHEARVTCPKHRDVHRYRYVLAKENPS